MEQSKNQQKIQVKLDLAPENLDTLNNDIKRLNEGLEKGCKSGVFGLKESQLLCTSLENFAQVLLLLSQSAQEILEKTSKKNNNNVVPDLNEKIIHNKMNKMNITEKNKSDKVVEIDE
jgi:hypothetical protein